MLKCVISVGIVLVGIGCENRKFCVLILLSVDSYVICFLVFVFLMMMVSLSECVRCMIDDIIMYML